MKRHHATLSVGLLVAATACGDILGIDDNSELVQCNADDNCTDRARPKCSAHKCVALGGTSGNAGNSHGGSGGLFATTGGTAGSGGSGIVSVSGGTGGVSSTTGGLAGTTASEGGTESIGSTGGKVASGGTQSIGGNAGTAGSTTVVGDGGIAGHGGATPSGGTGATSGATTSVAGTTQGGAGDHIVNGGTAGIGAAGTGAVGNNGGASGGGTGGVAGGSGTGTGGVGGGAGSGGCTPGKYRCFELENVAGNPVGSQACSATGTWGPTALCDDYCTFEKGCLTAPSCAGMELCLPSRSCCASIPIRGGTFNRSVTTDDEYNEYCASPSLCPATARAFSLDVYEVTVGRFRNFVEEYPANIPTKGSGSSNIPNSPGWDDAWNSRLPADQTKLVQYLQSCTGSTYTDRPLGNEYLPIACVDWYLAFAFCIWDGGRLPIELEWDYAATGGVGRVYPWSNPPEWPYITSDYAEYTPAGESARTKPANVGAHPAGVARWGQLDMAGNLLEWTADTYEDQYVATMPCDNCANLTWSSALRVARGGAYLFDKDSVTTATRMSAAVSVPLLWLGFRCARDLQ